MAKKTTAFFCSECGYESAKWLGQCPGCVESFSVNRKKSSIEIFCGKFISDYFIFISYPAERQQHYRYYMVQLYITLFEFSAVLL